MSGVYLGAYETSFLEKAGAFIFSPLFLQIIIILGIIMMILYFLGYLSPAKEKKSSKEKDADKNKEDNTDEDNNPLVVESVVLFDEETGDKIKTTTDKETGETTTEIVDPKTGETKSITVTPKVLSAQDQFAIIIDLVYKIVSDDKYREWLVDEFLLLEGKIGKKDAKDWDKKYKNLSKSLSKKLPSNEYDQIMFEFEKLIPLIKADPYVKPSKEKKKYDKETLKTLKTNAKRISKAIRKKNDNLSKGERKKLNAELKVIEKGKFETQEELKVLIARVDLYAHKIVDKNRYNEFLIDLEELRKLT